jgi:DNA-binding CsgD family transcriptional regulator
MNAILRLEAAVVGGRRRRESDGSAAILNLLRESDTPAVVSDMAGHVLLWNGGAEKLTGRLSHQALGRLCHDLLEGRDVYGNLFCHESCAVRAMCHKGEAIQPFELVLNSSRPPTTLQVSILKVPAEDPDDEDVIVHFLQPLDREGRLARELERLGNAPRGSSNGAPKSPSDGDHAAPLSPREREVLERMSEGLGNKEIAQKLDISLATTRNHVHNLLEKLGVHSKLEAISLAYRAGWVAGAPKAGERRSGTTGFPAD